MEIPPLFCFDSLPKRWTMWRQAGPWGRPLTTSETLTSTKAGRCCCSWHWEGPSLWGFPSSISPSPTHTHSHHASSLTMPLISSTSAHFKNCWKRNHYFFTRPAISTVCWAHNWRADFYFCKTFTFSNSLRVSNLKQLLHLPIKCLTGHLEAIQQVVVLWCSLWSQRTLYSTVEHLETSCWSSNHCCLCRCLEIHFLFMLDANHLLGPQLIFSSLRQTQNRAADHHIASIYFASNTLTADNVAKVTHLDVFYSCTYSSLVVDSPWPWGREMWRDASDRVGYRCCYLNEVKFHILLACSHYCDIKISYEAGLNYLGPLWWTVLPKEKKASSRVDHACRFLIHSQTNTAKCFCNNIFENSLLVAQSHLYFLWTVQIFK